MNPAARRPFWLALIASLLLHLAVLTAPGWGLPLFDDESAVPLDTRIVIPEPAMQEQTKATPSPSLPKRPLPRPQPKLPAVPAAESPAPAPAPPEPAPVAEAVPVPAEASPEPATEPSLAVAPVPIFSHADIWPKQGRIVFQVTRGTEGFIVGQSEHQWRHDGTNYELRAMTETVGLAALFKPAEVLQESRGGFAPAGLQPREYSLMRDGKLKESARFDSEQRRIFLGNGHSAAYRVGTQDMLSLFYQLGAYSFDAGPFALVIASGRKISFFTVGAGSDTVLETSLGKREVRHLQITGPAREDATEVWLDILTRLPLKIRHRDRKGEIFDQIAMTVELEKNQP